VTNDTYQPSKSNYKIDFVYLYYVTEETLDLYDGFNLYEVQYNEPINMTSDDIEELIFRVDQGDPTLPVRAHHADEREWRHRSFLLFVIRHPEYRFEENNAITFKYLEGKIQKGNHSFRDGRDVKLGDANLTAMVCTNIRKNKDKEPLKKGEKEPFKITWNTNPPIPDPKAGPPQYRLHNETGTNTGP
jgi:hypothetical protein